MGRPIESIYVNKEVSMENFEMPTPCINCKEWFDLHDGYASDKWYPKTIICENCHEKESEEIELDERIEFLKENISECDENIQMYQDNKKQYETELENLENKNSSN